MRIKTGTEAGLLGVLIFLLLIAVCGIAGVLPGQSIIEVVDVNVQELIFEDDITLSASDWNCVIEAGGPSSSLTFGDGDGNNVVLDFSGKELKVTGDMDAGAKVLFDLLKDYIDPYIESKTPVCYYCEKEIAEVEKQRAELEKPVTKADMIRFVNGLTKDRNEVIKKTSEILTTHLNRIMALEAKIKILEGEKVLRKIAE